MYLLGFFLLFVFLLRFATGIEQAPRELRKRHRDSSERTPVESERYSEKRQQRNQNRRKRNCGGMYLCVCVWCVSVYTQIKKASKINNNINTSEGKSRHRERERERESSQKERETEITAGGGNRTVLTNKQNKHNNCWQTSKHTQTEATRNIHFSPGRME